MGLSPSIRSAEIADQQQSISDPTNWHFPNLASHILSSCRKKLQADWQTVFGHPVVLLGTFVDPQRFRGTIYKADNWIYAGKTKGFHRSRRGYSNTADSPKMVFVKPLISNAQALLSQPILKPDYLTGSTKFMLKAQHMKSLPDFFADIPDPRRAQGRRHRLSTVLAIATAATLCGMRSFLAISDWASSLGQKARERFNCRYENGRHVVPSLSIIRDVLVRVDPAHLDSALQRWNELYGQQDESLAFIGTTMCNAIDEQGNQTHIMSAVGHQTKICYTQKSRISPCRRQR
jgi:DDE_Tnp_1-associated